MEILKDKQEEKQMKTNRHLFTKILIALVLMLGVLSFTAPSTQAQAAKMTNKKAQKILKKKIKNKFCKYAFVDLDQDKISEMIVLGYSGKFVNGDDKKKTVSVYKVVNKKAKVVFNYSIEGDLFHPTLTFEVFRDKSGESYLKINHEHEGYIYNTTYYWNGTDFVEMGRKEDYVADNEIIYRVRTKTCTEKEYNDFMKDILVKQVKLDIKSCTVKVANKYLQKQLTAEFNYLCKINVYAKDDYNCVFDDIDGDGIDELIARRGPLGGIVLYAVPNTLDLDYSIERSAYKLVDGRVVYTDEQDDSYDDDSSNDEGDQYIGDWYHADGLHVVISKEDTGYFVRVTHEPNGISMDEWLYYDTEYQGINDNGMAVFSCPAGGTYVIHNIDRMTGEESENLMYDGEGKAMFFIEDDVLYWHDLNDEYRTYWYDDCKKIG